MADETKEIIETWLNDVHKASCSMDLGQIDDIVYRLKAVTLEDSESDKVFEEKENSVVSEKGKKQWQVPKQEIAKTEDADITSVDEETAAEYYKTVKDFGKVEFWKMNAKSNQIESRLDPQKFHHHVLQPAFLQDNKEKYQFKVNMSCPDSATDSELENYNLMRKKSVKENAMTHRFSRHSKSDHAHVEYLCRMCPFKRWIPMERFQEHMCLAHGILNVNGFGYVGLPPPEAVYRQSPGKLKCYYSKCPKCLRWIRLGKVAGVGRVSRKLRLHDKINNDHAVVGLYTNYFQHFMACSQEEEEPTEKV